jgi:hypothetical protein
MPPLICPKTGNVFLLDILTKDYSTQLTTVNTNKQGREEQRQPRGLRRSFLLNSRGKHGSKEETPNSQPQSRWRELYSRECLCLSHKFRLLFMDTRTFIGTEPD